MKPEEIHLSDTMRILLGQVPWSFLIEAAFRILFMYLLLLVSMRLMGKRFAAQLTRTEMAALVSLAAAQGVPLLSPDRGLLPVVIIALVVIGVQRLIAYLTFRSKKVSTLTNGDIGIMVEDGCLQFGAMETSVLSRERIFAELRSHGIDHLGQVRRTYMENDGSFSVIQQPEPRPGLSILPDWDHDFVEEQRKAENSFACGSCGYVVPARRKPEQSCQRCGKREWKQAVIS